MIEGDKEAEQQHAELLMLYEACVTEIAGFKSTALSFTNYALLLDAGIISVYQLDTVHLPAWLGDVVAAGIFVIFWAAQHYLHCSQEARRERMEWIRTKKFSPSFIAARYAGMTPPGANDFIYCTFVTIGALGMCTVFAALPYAVSLG